MKNKFTPLEKATDDVGGGIPYKADDGFQPEADPPLAEMPPLAQTVRERSSLTGLTERQGHIKNRMCPYF